jgi:FMN phosphatase YigB (HAD superfamily)
VFDLDGTLYDQGRLRAAMGVALAVETVRTRSLRLATILQTFREVREELADASTQNFARRQYQVTALRCGCTPDEVRSAVLEWMEIRPLKFLQACRLVGVERLFAALKQAGKTTAVLSDYPAVSKLAALGLAADVVVTAGEEDVARLKPDPKGLRKILAQAQAEAHRSLMIGDRVDRDWEVAMRVGMRAMIRSRRRHPTVETFRSYDDEVFRPLFLTDTMADLGRK